MVRRPGEWIMNTDPKPNLPELFPLPEGVKLRTRKFGAKPHSGLVPAPAGGDVGDHNGPRLPFRITWEDRQQGLEVHLGERSDHRLIADVRCADATMLNKAAV